MYKMFDWLVVTQANVCVFENVHSKRAFKLHDNSALGHIRKPTRRA